MAMTKKDFIALADQLRIMQACARPDGYVHVSSVIHSMVGFCHDQNPRFNEATFRGYIAGTCGPSGGAVKKGK